MFITDIKNRVRNFLGKMIMKKIIPTMPEINDRPRILILGIYLTDRMNSASHIMEELSKSKLCEVTQKWVAIGDSVPNDCSRFTVNKISKTPKFEILNKLLFESDLLKFDFIIISDDDIYLPKNFLDAFVSRQIHCKFDLAQPARTKFSFVDHKFVVAKNFLLARETRFVEIGPIFSVAKSAYDVVFPFDMKSPMGWGYDLVWPIKFSEGGLRMGIVDSTPISHSMRARGDAYSSEFELKRMSAYLGENKHIAAREAFIIKKKYYKFI